MGRRTKQRKKRIEGGVNMEYNMELNHFDLRITKEQSDYLYGIEIVDYTNKKNVHKMVTKKEIIKLIGALEVMTDETT